MATTTYTGEFKKFHFESIRDEIAEVMGDFAKQVPIDQITSNFIEAVENDLGFGWYLGTGYFRYPDGMPLDDVLEEMDFRFKEADLGDIICEYMEY